jgi:two-component system cell cycle sensor histidine kinase/response regulator CckA
MSEKVKILAVDDTPGSLALLVAILTPAGYEVRAADSGELALAAVAASPPDLILLDVRMEGVDGLEVCRRLKSREETRHIPIVLVSAYTEVAEWVEGLRLGAADFITKPFHPEVLLTRIGTHLALRRAEASLERQAAELREANERLQAEVGERRSVEDELRLGIDRTERSRRAMLSALEDQKRVEGALRESEQRLRLITDNVRDTIWLLDLGMRATWISPSVIRTRGYTLAELAEMPMDRQLTPASLARVMEILAARLTPERLADPSAEVSMEGELDFYRKDDGIFPADCVVTLLRDAEGKPSGFLGVGRDISDRKQAEQKRGQLEDQLRAAQKAEAVGSLAGGIAHDFNNLLSVILNYAGFALERMPEGDPIRDDILQVKKAGERAAQLTRQLLAFGRKQVLQPVPLDLNLVLADMEKMLRRIIGEDVDLERVEAPDLGLVTADPGQVEQVIMNLVVNARDAMPEGGKLTLETSNIEVNEEYAARHVAVTPGFYVLLAITDTGCGMDEQTKGRLFEPFFTTKAKGKGTGLGLSTVYGIVKQSGGNIWVYSELGKGTTFKIYLPRELTATVAATVRHPVVPRRTTGTETILVVEDEEALREVARRTLGAAGYEVLTAAGGDDALQLSAKRVGDIQLLLTDVVMPGMNGVRLAQKLLAQRPAVKVLYMSGYTDDAMIHHGVLDAGTNFLSKPFTALGLTWKVREVLDGGIGRAADGPPRTSRPDGGTSDPLLDKDAVGALPSEFRDKLRRAVVAARYDEIVELVETIRIARPDLATGLRRMADIFEYDGMRDLLGRQGAGVDGDRT